MGARQSTVRNVVSGLVIFGHLAVFGLGLALGVFSLLGGVDALQTILMATPVLSTTALAAFSYVMEHKEGDTSKVKVSLMYATCVVIFPMFLLLMIFALFYLFWLQLDGFGPEQLKISLGALETFFGAYLGAIAKSLFGSAKGPTAQSA